MQADSSNALIPAMDDSIFGTIGSSCNWPTSDGRGSLSTLANRGIYPYSSGVVAEIRSLSIYELAGSLLRLKQNSKILA